jgi:UDP-N-acetylglucosamine 2-epimerase (non-hydrolysing)
MKVAIVMGTRPEIIKLSPIINHLNKNNSYVILTGQHYDYDLSLQFIKELGIRKPDFSLNLSSSNPALQTGEMIMKTAKILLKINPDAVIVQGDTNTVLAAAIASLKVKIPIIHVESGLRSFDWRMPEEHNRIAVDHISELLFAPTEHAKRNLLRENIHGKIFVSGNTVIDAINKYADVAHKKSHISITIDNYILMTLHRTENVDNKKILSSIIKAITVTKENIIFPVHPHTLKKLHEFNLYNKLNSSVNILLIKSVGYFDMLQLMKNCSFILTDSGGIQEEATSPKIRKKVLVVRETTDRPEAVKAKMSEIIGTKTKRIVTAIRKTSDNPTINTKDTPYGKGDSANRIITHIRKYL